MDAERETDLSDKTCDTPSSPSLRSGVGSAKFGSALFGSAKFTAPRPSGGEAPAADDNGRATLPEQLAHGRGGGWRTAFRTAATDRLSCVSRLSAFSGDATRSMRTRSVRSRSKPKAAARAIKFEPQR
eukprot:3664408-Prymnesium_polylepis.1